MSVTPGAPPTAQMHEAGPVRGRRDRKNRPHRWRRARGVGDPVGGGRERVGDIDHDADQRQNDSQNTDGQARHDGASWPAAVVCQSAPV